ncbi:hypothetical protein ZIOFF_006435 [Zingiber officinale]|uniref:Expansin-like CBD domain-containing protein n=1 Tax=Zingiber officinale TaxID=94328 RepID=A0A8J5M2V5_ZINOF|nr:hypothetical protein ZIOFF_006435 [Zingiber officinale]
MQCYRGFNVAFRVDTASNANYLAIVIENVNGDGELTAVKLKEGLSGTWMAMHPSWGEQWNKLNAGQTLQPSFSFQLTLGELKKILIAHNIIPVRWTLGEHLYFHGQLLVRDLIRLQVRLDILAARPIWPLSLSIYSTNLRLALGRNQPPLTV